MKDYHPFDEIENVECVRECTGLMPALPTDHAAAANLAGLMAIHCPPGTSGPDPAQIELPGADARPSGAHSSPKNPPSARQASESAPRRPDAGRNH